MRAVVFIAAVAFAGAALAQNAPASDQSGAGQTPSTTSGQATVVVTEEAPAAPTTERMICRTERTMGSNIARKRVCRTASQIAEDQRNARQMMRQNERANGYQPPPQSMGGG
jgi:hypothetical protein